ncbi:MAG: hypothetical protein ACYC1F_10470 [Gallionellaceae bacterium]
MDEEELIDHLNTLSAQNIALTHALATLVQFFPEDAKAKLRNLYDMRCATFQNVVTLGKTDLSTLQIQREQFEKTRDRVFGA